MSEPQKPAHPDDAEIARLMPKPGVAFLLIPVLAIAFTFSAYAVIFGLGFAGREPTGAEVDVHLTGCSEGIDLVVARIQDMGLDPGPLVSDESGTAELRTRLPFEDTDPARFAEVLATPGTFAMKDGDEVLATDEDISYAGVRLDMTMTPSTLITLHDAGRDRVYKRMNTEPDRKTHMFMDGVEVWSFGNRRPTMNGEFEIPPDAANDRARMELAASRGIVLNNGPLPCPMTVTATPITP